MLSLCSLASHDLHAQSWQLMGPPSFAGPTENCVAIAKSPGGVVYLAYRDANNDLKAGVKKFDGSNWVDVGAPGISDGAVERINIAIDNSGVPYIVFKDIAHGNGITAMKFDGANWVAVGTTGFTASLNMITGHRIALQIDHSGTPYVAYDDFVEGGKVTVRKFDGTSWVAVGSPCFTVNTSCAYISLALDNADVPYVSFADGLDKVSVMKFDGSSWNYVGAPNFSDGFGGFTSIVIDGSGTPYVSYSDNPHSQGATVKKFNGAAWQTLGTENLSGGNAYYPMLGLDNTNALYLSYSDIDNGSLATVKKFDGTNWIPVGVPGFSSDYAFPVYMIVDGENSVKLAYRAAADGKVTAWSYNALPPVSPITGNTSVCIGTTTPLSNATPGGTWSSTNTSAATVNNSGLVTGRAVGTTVIRYTVGASVSTLTMTVNPTGTISGIPNTCIGTQTTLHQTETTGIWLMHSGSVALASVVPSTGVITGITNGVALIDYVTPASCVSTYSVTVGTLPSITGPSVVTAGSSITLSNPLTGGTWSSGNMSVATTDAASGMVTGVAFGTAVINYEVATGCSASKTITVNPGTQPNTLLCVGTAITLSDGAAGGSWSSGSGAIATVNSSGLVIGVNAGNTIIKHLLPSGLIVNFPVTVNPRAATTGLSVVCQGQNIILVNNTSGGGTWSSANDGIATVGATGIVTGTGAGNTAILFATPAGCIASKTVSVNPTPGISGPSSVCVGQTMSLSSSAAGAWSTSSAALASVSAAGVVKGITAGNVRISYMLPTGCFTTRSVTVNPLATTTGMATVCQGMQIILANTTVGGGTWSSANTTIATAAGSGVITGIGAGNTAILFTTPAGCIATKTITVNATPQVSGANSVCASQALQLSSNASGGVWTSSTASYATVSNTGLVRGVAAGTVRISYGIAGGCQGTTTLSVRPLLATTGAAAICSGQQLLLGNNTPGGGTWSTSNSSVAAVVFNGVVTGNSGGMAVISFTTPAGCVASKTVTVNSAALITAPSSVCAGQTVMVSSNTPGGTWSSSNNALATVSATRIVTGVAAGTVRISYNRAGAACPAIATITVYPLLSIAGSPSGCVNRPMTLTNGTPGGGTWTSSNTLIATVSSSGIVSGNSIGTVAISFTSLQGCTTSKTVTIGALPTISGIPVMCVGQTTTMSGSPSGGYWYTSTDALARAAVATGVITGVSAGSPGITYVLPTGCWAAQGLTVKPLNITTGGSPSMCQSGSFTVVNTTVGGGTWNTANTSIATISPTGVVRGVAPGTTSILFTTPLGCTYTRPLTINACREGGEATAVSAITGDEIRLYPNPNNGQFTLAGTIANVTEDEVGMEIVNMLGQVIHRSNIPVRNGRIEERLELPGTLARGTYILNLRTNNSSKLFRFVLD